MKYLLSLLSGGSIFVQCSYGGFSAGSRRFSAVAELSLLLAVAGKFLAVLGRFSPYLQRVFVSVGVGFNFCRFWKAWGRQMVPGWSEKWPQRAQEATKQDEKTMLILQSVFGRFPGCERKSFSSQFGAILGAILEPKSFQNRTKHQ